MDFNLNPNPSKLVENQIRYNQSVDFHESSIGRTLAPASTADLVSEVIVESRNFNRRRNRYDSSKEKDP